MKTEQPLSDERLSELIDTAHQINATRGKAPYTAEQHQAHREDVKRWRRLATPKNILDLYGRLQNQAAEIERLRSALDKLARLGNGDKYGTSIGNEIARAALEQK